MSNRISNTITELINDKLEQYRQLLDENNMLYNQLVETMNNTPQSINMELISRVDDVLEDIANMGVNCKLILSSIRNNTSLNMSEREEDRTFRYNQIRQLLPLLFLFSLNSPTN
jgi:hypothetical protein